MKFSLVIAAATLSGLSAASSIAKQLAELRNESTNSTPFTRGSASLKPEKVSFTNNTVVKDAKNTIKRDIDPTVLSGSNSQLEMQSFNDTRSLNNTNNSTVSEKRSFNATQEDKPAIIEKRFTNDTQQTKAVNIKEKRFENSTDTTQKYNTIVLEKRDSAPQPTADLSFNMAKFANQTRPVYKLKRDIAQSGNNGTTGDNDYSGRCDGSCVQAVAEVEKCSTAKGDTTHCLCTPTANFLKNVEPCMKCSKDTWDNYGPKLSKAFDRCGINAPVFANHEVVNKDKKRAKAAMEKAAKKQNEATIKLAKFEDKAARKGFGAAKKEKRAYEKASLEGEKAKQLAKNEANAAGIEY